MKNTKEEVTENSDKVVGIATKGSIAATLQESLGYLRGEVNDVEMELRQTLMRDDVISNLYDYIRESNFIQDALSLQEVTNEVKKLSPKMIFHLRNMLQNMKRKNETHSSPSDMSYRSYGNRNNYRR